MGTLYKFRDTGGIIKWGEISISYNPNRVEHNDKGEPLIPVVIDYGYPDAGKLRMITASEILESR